MDKYDVAVIGAGPAGSLSARCASMASARTILLEEHPIIGWPVECAGLLGIKAIEESGIISKKHIQDIFGAAIYSPGGNELHFKAKSARAWVVDRRFFDREMARLALDRGAELRLSSQVRRIHREKNWRVLKLAGGEEIAARIVISAEGVRARLSHKAGIPSAKLILSGAQVEVPFEISDPERVEVHLGEAPGLFAWVIPAGRKMARIGLCTRTHAYDYLKKFLEKDIIKNRIRGSAVAINVGGLPIGPPPITVAEGFLAVGDAAGQVKPTSGGGIYPGLVAAKIAGKVAADAANEINTSVERLAEYDRLWRQALLKEIEVGMKVNGMLSRMEARDLDEIIGYMAAKPKIQRLIENFGDIDRPSDLLLKMLHSLDWDAIPLARFLKYVLF